MKIKVKKPLRLRVTCSPKFKGNAGARGDCRVSYKDPDSPQSQRCHPAVLRRGLTRHIFLYKIHFYSLCRLHLILNLGLVDSTIPVDIDVVQDLLCTRV